MGDKNAIKEKTSFGQKLNKFTDAMGCLLYTSVLAEDDLPVAAHINLQRFTHPDVERAPDFLGNNHPSQIIDPAYLSLIHILK